MNSLIAALLVPSLLLTATSAAPPEEPERSSPVRVSTNVVKSDSVELSFKRPTLTSSPAPEAVETPPEAPKEYTAASIPAQEQQPTNTTKKKVETPVPESKPEPAPEPEKAAPVTAASGSIASAALAQVGVAQDCTALAENALRAAGHSVGDLAPAQFFAYGTVTSNPQPGDLAYYDDAGAGVPHIAVYIGGGKAVHGGWMGTTAVNSVNVGSGPVFIHVA